MVTGMSTSVVACKFATWEVSGYVFKWAWMATCWRPASVVAWRSAPSIT